MRRVYIAVEVISKEMEKNLLYPWLEMDLTSKSTSSSRLTFRAFQRCLVDT